jgi:transposase
MTKRADAIKGFVVIPKRWIVERTFGGLNLSVPKTRRCRNS